MEELIAAPDLMVAEWANVLSAKALRRAIDRDLTGAGLAAMLAAPVDLLPAASRLVGVRGSTP